MSKICKTCRLWFTKKDIDRVGVCKSPLVAPNTVDIDTSQLVAGAFVIHMPNKNYIMTGMHFGCVHHEKKEK